MVGAIFMAFLMVNLNSQASTSRDQGVDWSKLGVRKSKRIGNEN